MFLRRFFAFICRMSELARSSFPPTAHFARIICVFQFLRFWSNLTFSQFHSASGKWVTMIATILAAALCHFSFSHIIGQIIGAIKNDWAKLKAMKKRGFSFAFFIVFLLSGFWLFSDNSTLDDFCCEALNLPWSSTTKLSRSSTHTTQKYDEKN